MAQAAPAFQDRTSTGADDGLGEEEAARRLRLEGPNRLAAPPVRPLGAIVLGVFSQPMFLLLLGTAGVYAVVGKAADALVLLVSVAGVAAITLYQEYRTERVLDSLKQLSSPRARVVRGGRVITIPSQEIVRGDRLLVGEGDRMACDATIVRSQGLLLDESLLTGESAPVSKGASRGTPDAREVSRLHAGTLVVRGDGVAVVEATGAATALGRIGGALASIGQRPSRVQTELKQVVTRVAVCAALASAGAALLYTLRQGSWVEGLIMGLTLAMAIIPEEFAVVWTVMLALGAWRLARAGVLTRQAQAIEALGTTTVLCVDKTGTLTHNRMALVRLVLPDRVTAVGAGGQVDPAFRPLLRAAARASVEHGLEPMDQAVLRLHAQAEEPRPAGEVLVRRDGIATGRPYITALWQRGGSPGGTLAVKGAPEAVLDLCTLPEATRLELLHSAEALAADGLRVLGVAEAPWQGQEPSSEAAAGLRWTGLLGFLDPVRADVPAAMERCRQAGIRVTMITGDAPATALAIARAAGLTSRAPSPSCVISGAQLEVMSDQALQDAVATASIFARVSPDQKLRIVRALQQRGEVVAMTGDGVNDASALRAADIGVAMGRRGTDVAREAAALVLLQDNFAAMVEAVRVGRRIFGNLHNAVGYLIAVHVPIVGVSLLPILVGGPVLLLPLHVVLLELIIDPACSLVFEAEPEPEDCMRRPPRPFNVRLLSTRAARRAVAIGSLALALTVGSVMLGRAMALDAHWLRLVALVALVAGNLLMLHWYRRGARWRGEARINAAFRWLLAGVCGALAIVALLSGPLPQLGLPDHPGLRTAGLVLALASLAGIALLLRGIRPDAAGPAGGKGRS